MTEGIRSALISTVGAGLHTLLGGKDKLEKTAEEYIKKVGVIINVDEESKKSLEYFKKSDRGIIIGNHSSGNFADYLPLFKELGKEILDKTIFYTGSYNLNMNKREFPDYTFRPATFNNNNEGKNILENLKKDIEKIQNNGGYIFIIPSGANTDKNAAFQGIFRKMIKEIKEDFPILATDTKHNWTGSYVDILKGLMPLKSEEEKRTTISIKYSSSTTFSGKQGDKMREEYNNLF